MERLVQRNFLRNIVINNIFLHQHPRPRNYSKLLLMKKHYSLRS